ncbi:hypothetical protein HQ590_09205, partial [bacterium]|nr:hypothetical protein [bacterium]
ALRAVAAVRMSGRASEAVRSPVTNLVLRTDPAKLAALIKYEPSPLKFVKVSGHQVPVARLPGKLGTLEVKGSAQAITLDGMVSDAEIAMSWKSGQFRADAPGKPPPFGQPPTYCYVGQADLAGKPHLYISFVCLDPNVDGIINTYDNVWRAMTTITRDDSIEIFLDTNFNRTDYQQLIVNTRGYYWGQYCRSFRDDGTGSRWDPKPQIKSSVSKETGRWTCEIMIPFDQLGGVPPKGKRWSVNFNRNYRGQKGANHQLQNWFLVYESSTASHYYHNPARFGVFQW